MDIDFVRRARLVSPVGGWLLLAGLAVACAVGVEYLDASDDLGRAQTQQARLLRQLKPAPVPRPVAGASVAAAEDTLALARVQAQLLLPWDAVLREFEQIADPAVALLGVDAQGQTQVLRVTGEARSMADVVAYAGRLRASPWIQSAYVSGHEAKAVGAASVVRFVLDVRWRAPT